MAEESAPWPVATVADVACQPNGIAIGPFGSNMKADLYVSQGVAVVRGNNIGPARELVGEFVYVPDEVADRLPGALIDSGDLLFPHRGAIGQVAIAPRVQNGRMLLSTSMMRLRCDLKVADPVFVYYWFRSDAGRSEILQYTSTVGTPGIGQPTTSLRRMKLPLPPLTDQRAIVGVLGALDDKIESNCRLITLLESVFNVECEALLAADTAPLAVRLGDVAEISLGGTPSRDRAEYWRDGTIPWINSGCLHQRPVTDPADFITDLGLRRSATKFLRSGTTVVAITGATLGVTSRLAIDAAVNQSVVGVSALDDRALNDFLYFEVQKNIEVLISTATGAAQQHVNKSNFEDLVVQVPSRAVLEEVSTLGPLLDRQAALGGENRTLTALRDALLPELLSGRLRVREAEKVIEDVV